VNYLDMCNEVLVRMREEEITSVQDADNDPQQKLVTKFVNDAKALVERSHTWNASRKLWVIDLAHEVYRYSLKGAAEQSSIYLVRYDSGAPLREANSQWLARQGRQQGNPHWYAPSHVDKHTIELHIHPRPDNTFGGTGDIFEYTVGQYGVGSFAAPDKQLFVYGYGQQETLKSDSDEIIVPTDAVMHYALAYAQRERGEAGGQNSQEVFAMAKQYLSDAISWDVNNSELEYTWRAV
jgi:hypothetical protein